MGTGGGFRELGVLVTVVKELGWPRVLGVSWRAGGLEWALTDWLLTLFYRCRGAP